MGLPMKYSLVIRPHPLTRTNDLVNQVEFLGLAQIFATVSPSNGQNFCAKSAPKRYGYSSKKIDCCKGSAM